ncbi:MAG: aminopeptidase P family protein [Verrucomicrobia subdivision 3 bacterium]|nr:aminopeptidase P family protein [Verrucomicrobiota bacterium]MCC6822450.1 aminopeptidase P family protein [Limisphaerales bacterium]
MKSSENLLMVADSEHDANMLYAVGMFVPDPFIYLRLRGRSSIVLSDLEIDRARRDAPHCRPLPLSRCQDRLRKAGVKSPGHAQVIASLLRERRIRRVLVPPNFPLGLADELKRLRIAVRPTRGNFFPQREQKTPAEVKKISAALMMAEVGMSEAMQVLRSAKIGRDRRLLHHNIPLTSERLRAVIDTAILQAGGLAANTIVAGGKQGCDPHERGFGPLRAQEPIIIDIFPRSQTTGYFGDITRTVVRGRASEAVRRLYDTVRRGQKIGFDRVRAGVPTADVHHAVLDYFAQEGYKTGRRLGRMEGFFHGTGHGVGLEIHEAPRLGQHSTGNLLAGQVVTVEPGLYYPELGGIRLEDVALVTQTGARNLTQFEKALEL